jgi:3-dehydroquinate synthetase
MNKTYAQIQAAATEHRIDLLKQFKETLSFELEMMDTFFEKFLERNQLDRKKKSTSNWTIYTKKIAEYGEVSDNLKVVDFFLEKYNV